MDAATVVGVPTTRARVMRIVAVVATLGALAAVALAGRGHSTVPVDPMSNDPLSTAQVPGLREVSAAKDAAHTSLGMRSPSRFRRILAPRHGGQIDQPTVNRLARAAMRAGWDIPLTPRTSYGYSRYSEYRGAKRIGRLDVDLIIAIFPDRTRVAVYMTARNEELLDDAP
jgi:hypothetical protein